jgi:TolB-like protein
LITTAFSQDNVLSQKVSQLADKLAFAVEGDVLGVSEDTVYINLGQESGIVEGIQFEVVRLDKDRPFKMDDRIIGYPETEIGLIEITAVRKEMSLAKITEKLMDIQEGDKVYQQMKKVTRVAITEFTYADEYNSFTRNVQDMLYTSLIQRGMTVVEREKMEQVMEELAQSFSGMIDTSTAAEIGKMLGVEAVIVGTVADMGNSVDLRARLVDVEKGTAITAAQVAVVKDPMISDILSRGTRKASFKKSVVGVSEEREEGEEVPLDISKTWTYYSKDRWKASLASYQWIEDSALKFNILIENLEDRPYHFKFNYESSDTYLLDEFGHKYFKPTGDLSKNFVQVIQNVPLKKYVEFQKINPDVRTVFVYLNFDLQYSSGSSSKSITFLLGPVQIEQIK